MPELRPSSKLWEATSHTPTFGCNVGFVLVLVVVLPPSHMLLWSAPCFRGRSWHRAKATADELFSRLYEPLKRVIAQRLGEVGSLNDGANSGSPLRAALSATRHLPDTPNDEAFGFKRLPDLGDLVALDFDAPVLHRAAGAARRAQLLSHFLDL
jgi:hypothetical protein